jgi:hypothetical protein
MIFIMTGTEEANYQFAVNKKANNTEQIESFVVQCFFEGLQPLVLTELFKEHELGYFLRRFGNSGRPSLSLADHDSIFSFFSSR